MNDRNRIDLVRKNMTLKQIVLVCLKHKGLRGGIIFVGLLIGSCLFLDQNSVMVFIETHFTSQIADLTAWILRLLGMKVSSSGISVTGSGFGVDIKYGCNAVYEMIVFSAAMAASPIEIKNRISGILIGAVFIYVLNILRVFVLFLSGVYFPEMFKLIHENIAQNVFIFCLAVLWIFWIARYSGRASAR